MKYFCIVLVVCFSSVVFAGEEVKRESTLNFPVVTEEIASPSVETCCVKKVICVKKIVTIKETVTCCHKVRCHKVRCSRPKLIKKLICKIKRAKHCLICL